MNFRSISPILTALVVAAVLWCGLAAARAQQPGKEYDVEGVYLKGYMMVQEAEKLERTGNFAGAFFKYKDASEIFDSVARGYPNWQPSMVTYRRNLVRKKMEESRQLERDRRSNTPGAPAELLPDATNPDADRIADAPATSVRPAVPVTPGVDRQLNTMQQRLQGYTSQSDELQKQLQAKESELFKVKQDLLASRKEVNAAWQKQIELQGKVDTADAKRDREVGDLKKKLDAATAAFESAGALQDEATKKIDGLLTDLAAARQTIAQLSKEKDALVAEKNQMLALIQGKDGMSGVDLLISENKRLKEQLDDANTKVATLTTDKEAAVKEAVALREQITAVRDELDRTKKENEDYRQQIAGLRGKLEAVTEQLADAAPNTKGDAELVGENKMLRKMILDQLKHQTFREEKKRLALEQLAKLQINNEDLLNTLDQIAAPPPTLSPEETQRMQDPVISRFLEKQGLSGTIIAKADGGAGVPPAPDESAAASRAVRRREVLSADLQSVAEAGLAAFGRGQVTEAGRAFRTVLKEDPTNVFALTNLAVVQVKQQDLAGAEKTLKKALAYDEQDGFCHYLLGFVSYREGNLDEAERSLGNALQFDTGNARAHFTLGCVHNKKHAVADARREFLSALAIDPAYADAHYNLAVIYASEGDREKAREHYQKALEHGAAPDTNLEKALAQNDGTR